MASALSRSASNLSAADTHSIHSPTSSASVPSQNGLEVTSQEGLSSNQMGATVESESSIHSTLSASNLLFVLDDINNEHRRRKKHNLRRRRTSANQSKSIDTQQRRSSQNDSSRVSTRQESQSNEHGMTSKSNSKEQNIQRTVLGKQRQMRRDEIILANSAASINEKQRKTVSNKAVNDVSQARERKTNHANFQWYSEEQLEAINKAIHEAKLCGADEDDDIKPVFEFVLRKFGEPFAKTLSRRELLKEEIVHESPFVSKNLIDYFLTMFFSTEADSRK